MIGISYGCKEPMSAEYRYWELPVARQAVDRYVRYPHGMPAAGQDHARAMSSRAPTSHTMSGGPSSPACATRRKPRVEARSNTWGGAGRGAVKHLGGWWWWWWWGCRTGRQARREGMRAQRHLDGWCMNGHTLWV